MNRRYLAPIVVLVLSLAAITYAAQQLTIPGSFTVITPASLSSSPSSLGWGPIVQGGPPSTQTFTLTNNGGASATGITCVWVWVSPSIPPAGITVGISACPSSLSASATSLPVSVTITVSDTALEGSYSGNVVVEFS